MPWTLRIRELHLPGVWDSRPHVSYVFHIAEYGHANDDEDWEKYRCGDDKTKLPVLQLIGLLKWGIFAWICDIYHGSGGLRQEKNPEELRDQ